jgi:hypothetical protein
MTSKTTELGLTASVSEKSTVIIKLNNLSTKSTTAYLTQGLVAGDSGHATASYAWKYDNMFAKGPEDGIYNVEVIARDDAGNESAPRTLEAVRIDRTPPKIYGQITSPYVLSNMGANAYKTTLSYNLAEAKSAKIKIYNTNTGALVDTIPAAPSADGVNRVLWDGSSSALPKGAYKFQLIAEDEYGNVGTAFASCVKDGIAPVISFPAEDNAEVAGTIAIRGTAIDPDWTNDRPFKNYKIFYKKNGSAAWESNFAEVPLINRGPSDPKNVSSRPLQNDSTLAYLQTNSLENGDYEIRVEVEEDGGAKLTASRRVKVDNDSLSASSIQSPYVRLKPVPSAVEFKSDDSVKLPLGFLNSVKPANVYVEVVRPSPRSGEGGPSPEAMVDEVVFFKYFPNILGAPFIGKPDYQAGTDLGYFIWSDDDGYHLRWSADGNSHKFTGSIVLVGSGSYADVKQIGGGITVRAPLISWDTSLSGGEGGIDFKAASGQLMITPKIDEDPSSPSFTADNVYLGVSRFSQQYLPIIIDAAGQRLVDVSSMGRAAESSNLERSTQNIEWNGKLDTGAYVDNGTYIIRVRAEGADGVGVATDEALVEIKTPFSMSVKEVTPANREFSSLSMPDRVSVQYTVSKDSLVTANVFDSNGQFKAKISDSVEVLGSANAYNLSWRGNYPDPESGQVATGGKYEIVLTVAAKDGSESRTETIDGISVTSFNTDDKFVSLSPVGEERPFFNGTALERIRLASGDSPYFLEIKGHGKYHPPKDFSYTLTATGKQRITAYPYVPFAALMHRGFNRVNIKTKNNLAGNYADFVCNPKFGEWWDRDGGHDFDKEINSVTAALTAANYAPFSIVGSGDTNQLFGAASGVGQPGKAFNSAFLRIHFLAQGDESLELDTVDIPIAEKSYSFSISMPIDVVNKGSPAIDKYVSDFVSKQSFDYSTSLESVISTKGIFRVSLNKTNPRIFKTLMLVASPGGGIGTGGISGVSNYSCQIFVVPANSRSERQYYFNVNASLEAPIAYSRLTNRFVPWIGFTNKNNRARERQDFSGYLGDLNKLGFPGRSYFMGETAKSATAPHKGNFDAGLFSANPAGLTTTLKVDGQNIIKPQADQIKSLTDSKMSGTASDYTSYLSDEYLEFIPITSPLEGKIEYNGSAVANKIALTKQAAYPFVASTSLSYDQNGEGGKSSPFEFSWPWNESEYLAVREQQTTKQKALDNLLGGNPQNYTGPTLGGTWWELDTAEMSQRRAEKNNTRIGFGQVRFNKSSGRSEWESAQSADQILEMPASYLVLNPKYSVVGNTTGITVKLDSSSPGAKPRAEDDDTAGLEWTTADDSTLVTAAGNIKSPGLAFNPDTFLGQREYKVSSYYDVKDAALPAALKYSFLKRDPYNDLGESPVDNPNLVIDGWEVSIRDRTGNTNKDIELKGITLNGKRLEDTFALGLKLDATEARYVEVLGSAAGAYELMFFDGKTWKSIVRSNEGRSGRLAWWNVSRLNGKYTLLLRSGSFVSTQDIQIGTLVPKEGGDAFSAYKRAQLKFPSGAFVNGSKVAQDQLVTVTPVTMDEIFIRNKPIIVTSGPIVELKPSPWKFIVSSEAGADLRPTLKFIYTFDDLKELNAWNGEGTPANIPWNIHQVTENGDLQIVHDNMQSIEDAGDEKHYVFAATLDHFSTYALLPGKFTLSAPMVFADRYITNKENVNIYGTAEPGSVLSVYSFSETKDKFADSESFATAKAIGDKGTFLFENVPLRQEGNNYIYVTSHPEGNAEVMTYSDVTIVKDTVPPSVEASQNLYAFSPNGDGKYDTVEYLLKSGETGKIYLGVRGQGAGGRG